MSHIFVVFYDVVEHLEECKIVYALFAVFTVSFISPVAPQRWWVFWGLGSCQGILAV